MSLEAFMDKFADDSPAGPVTIADQWQASQQPGALDKFINQFQGVTDPYFFYYSKGEPTVELRFQTDEHVYYLVGPLGELTPQDGVTTICHIIDKSNALVPWSAKMVVQKLLNTIPTVERLEPVIVNDATEQAKRDWVKAGSPTFPVKYLPEMSFESFEKICLEAKSAPRDKLEESGDIGHMAHTWLEYFIKAIIAKDQGQQQYKLNNMPKDERAHNCVLAALAWMKAHNVRWIATERKIYSKKYGYAGTTDGLALVDSCDDPTCCMEHFKDRLSVIDWKSSNYLYIEYLYQTAAYQNALTEEFGDAVLEDYAGIEDAQIIIEAIAKYGEIVDRWILRLGKEDGEFDPWHAVEEDFQEDLEGFLDALSLTRSVRLTEERMKGQKKQRKEAKKAVKAAEKEAEKTAKKQAREQAKAERRAKKAAEKEAIKAAKKAERVALKAKIMPAVIESTVTGRITTSAPELQTYVELEREPADHLQGWCCPLALATKGEQHKMSCDLKWKTPQGTEPEPVVITADFAEIERRVLATLPQEELASYGINLPTEG